MFVGFYWGGWSLGSTADKMAKERSDLAVVSALAPVCADKFRALPDADAKKVALSKVDSWKRRTGRDHAQRFHRTGSYLYCAFACNGQPRGRSRA
jgi:hypothetical protein